jgi:phenylalanyl-tRNA synthetase beta chain
VHISLDWISDYVDLSGLSTREIAERLTLATAEVEGVEMIHRHVEGVLVGEIVSAERLDTSGDKLLTCCKVECGGKTYQTVCGAPNAKVGVKAPFAPAGTKLAGGVEIQRTEMGDCVSEGVLCSASELGMSRWHEGLLECPASIPNGTPISDLVPESDTLIEIDNKSLTHRPDLWGHYGFAREFAAIFRRPLKPLGTVDLSQYDELPAYPLSNEDQENCPCYACMEFGVEAGVPSPLTVQRRLHALGQRTFNLMIDITNYCMLEIGQPTHAFDAGRLQAVRVAPMGQPGKFTTLDEKVREMEADDLLIWNEKEPVALAGVMGGENSEVGVETTKVLLESANFKSSRVRKTSVRLGLRTDAAQRFEKSQPPSNTKVAIARILQLLIDADADPAPTTRFTIEGNLSDSVRTITLEPGRLDAMAGIELAQEEVVSILESLGLGATFGERGELNVDVPPYRGAKDISIEQDIAEEVLRVYGYDRIEPRMPEMPMRPLHREPSIRIEHKIRRLLAGAHGFVELHNYGWTDDSWLEKIGYDPDPTIRLRNPATQSCPRMRTTLIPNILALVDRNRTHRDVFRLFEIGNVYLPDGPGSRIELPRLSGVSFVQSGPTLEEHFRQVKGAIEDLNRLCGGPEFSFTPSVEADQPWRTPDLWVEIKQGDVVIGALGVVDPKLLEVVSPEGGQVVWFEIELDKLSGEVYPVVQYEAAPRYPGSWQDFSMVWPVERGFSELVDLLDQFAQPLVTKRDFLYAYKGKGVGKGLASYSFRYWIGAQDHTLDSTEIEGFRDAFFAFLKENEIELR